MLKLLNHPFKSQRNKRIQNKQNKNCRDDQYKISYSLIAYKILEKGYDFTVFHVREHERDEKKQINKNAAKTNMH